jgi:hypothetical protein
MHPPVPVGSQLRLPGEAVAVCCCRLDYVCHHVTAVSIDGNVIHHLKRRKGKGRKGKGFSVKQC